MFRSIVIFIYIVSVIFCLTSFLVLYKDLVRRIEERYKPLESDMKQLKKQPLSNLLLLAAISVLPVLNIWCGIVWIVEEEKIINNLFKGR